MNNIIRARRSIRSFKTKEIPQDEITELLVSAMCAPSPKNRQPWKFVVCTGKTKLKIAKLFKEKISKDLCRQPDSIMLNMAMETANIIQIAPVLVLVCYDDTNNITHTNDGMLWDMISPQAECCDVQAIGAAIQNLILEAKSRGIGSLWVCDILYAYDEIKRALDISNTFIAGIVLGYADENPTMPKRNFNKVHWLK